MSIQYIYTHICNHTATGPIISVLPHTTAPPPPLRQIPLSVPFPCPFCHPNTKPHLTSILPSAGLLCVLTPNPRNASPSNSNPIEAFWTIIRPCYLTGISLGEWTPSTAWIPKPVGEVRIIGGREEGGVQRGVFTSVESKRSWRRGDGDGNWRVMSAMPGLVSQLGAAVWSGRMAGR